MQQGSMTTLFLVLATAVTVLTGCAGGKTFNNYARAGDTVAVATGWNHHFDRDNIEVTIVDSAASPTIYTAPNAAIRGSINFYPDPLSGMVLSDRLGFDVSPFGFTYSGLVNNESTSNDRDWWQTVVFVDLPATMATGLATISIADLNVPAKEAATSTVDIISSTSAGSPNVFTATLGPYMFDMMDAHFESLERVDHYVIEFTGTTVPDAIQIDLAHDPDVAHGGTGTPYVVNPVGTIKSLNWAATGTAGTDLRVIMLPSRDGEIATMNDFKFYVAGGIANVAVSGAVQAFDASGSPVAGVSAVVTLNN